MKKEIILFLVFAIFSFGCEREKVKNQIFSSLTHGDCLQGVKYKNNEVVGAVFNNVIISSSCELSLDLDTLNSVEIYNSKVFNGLSCAPHYIHTLRLFNTELVDSIHSILSSELDLFDCKFKGRHVLFYSEILNEFSLRNSNIQTIELDAAHLVKVDVGMNSQLSELVFSNTSLYSSIVDLRIQRTKIREFDFSNFTNIELLSLDSSLYLVHKEDIDKLELKSLDVY